MRSTPTTVAGMFALLVLAGTAASAQETVSEVNAAPLAVRVLVLDRAGVGPRDWKVAEAAGTTIYRQAGVRAVWLKEACWGLCRAVPSIVARSFTSSLIASTAGRPTRRIPPVGCWAR